MFYGIVQLAETALFHFNLHSTLQGGGGMSSGMGTGLAVGGGLLGGLLIGGTAQHTQCTLLHSYHLV